MSLYREYYGRGKKTYADAYDTVWRNGLWVKMWELGVRGKMWREMYRVSRSAVLFDGECSEAVDVQQGVAQGCSFKNEVEQAGFGVELSDGSTARYLQMTLAIQRKRLVNVAHAYCCKWVVVFAVSWKWALPRLPT